MRRMAVVAALIALVASTDGLLAQMSPGARSVAMGGGGMVFATGVDAVEWNPANLGWAGGWNVAVFETGVSALSTGATVNEIMTIFGAELPGSEVLDVSQVIAGLPTTGIRLNSVSEGFTTAKITGMTDAVPSPGSPLPSIGIAIGSVGIRARSRVRAEGTMSRDLLDLIGVGFVPQNIQNYSVGNTGWSTTSFSEVTLSYGTNLGGLSVGVGGRYVMGHGMVKGRFFEPEIDLNTTSLSVQTVAVEATTGSGYGLDVGLSFGLPGGFRVAASGTNVMQRMTWDENALVAHTATFTDQDFDGIQDFVDLLDRFDEQPLNASQTSLAVYEASQGLFEESYFPQVFRGGFGWQAGGTSLEAVGIKVAPRGRYKSAWDERVSLGVEQKLPLLTLRAGYAMAEESLTALTGGIGLGVGPINLEVSGGKFSGTDEALPMEGYYATFALQLKGGGL